MHEGYFERTAPEKLQIDPVRLERVIDLLTSSNYGIHAFLLLRHGKVAAEVYLKPYRPDVRHTLFSVSKSFTSIGVGFAIGEGKLSLEDAVVSFFPELLPAGVCENMAKMKIRDLLTMSPGFDAAPHDFKRHRRDDIVNDFPYSYENFIFRDDIDWAKDFLRSYVARAPGREFIYSNACPYILSAILQKVSGETLLSYLDTRLFCPLGIRDVWWEAGPAGRTVGGWGLRLRPEELAKFAQFMLQKGKWEGKQLLDPAYIEAATSCQIKTGNTAAKWEGGFGYQIWILGEEGAFAGIGAFGQMYMVFPKQDAALVLLGGSRTYMKAVDHIMMTLVPAMLEEGEKIAPAPEKRESPARALPVSEGLSSWDVLRALRYSGIEYVFSENYLGLTSIQFDFGAEDFVTLGIRGKKSRMKIGYGDWAYGYTGVQEDTHTDAHTQIFYHAAALSGAWAGDTYQLDIVFYETCYRNHMEIAFSDHGVRIKHTRNVGFVQSADTELIGARVTGGGGWKRDGQAG